MSRADRGRIPYVNPENPQSWGRDDYTGLPVMHPDMVKQMEYIGNGLAWTGFMVHYKDADQPNPQKIPPRLKPDPIPIPNPRYLQLTQAPSIPSNLRLTGKTDTTISVEWDAVTSDVEAYVVGWKNVYVPIYAETRGITDTTYIITGLSPGNTYNIYVASTADNSSAYASEFSTSAFSQPIQQTTLSS